MKKHLSTLFSTLQVGARGGLLILALIASSSLWAYDFQSGDLYYNITSSSAPYTVEVTYEEWGSSSNYYGLTSATIPETVTYNGTTYSVTSIGDGAFYGCSSLTSVTIPNSVTSIGGGAFKDCFSLTSITIPNSVTSIGEDTFGYCSSLISVAIPNSVTSIGDEAFSRCSSLTSVTIPNSVTSIGNGAFSYCRSLTSITIPNGVTSIGGCTFENCLSLTSITIPNSVRSIGYRAFCQCSLTSITIPNSVTSIGNEAFYRCKSLTSITIPNSVTSIGGSAFDDCSALTSVTIGNSVTSIGDYAFYDCSSIDTVYIKAIQPPLLGGLSFYNVSPFICYIPLGTLENYKASDWAEYVSQFVEIEYPVDPTCQITYASSTGKVVKPYKTDVFGANIVSNEYKDKIGTITFDGPVTSIGDGAFYSCSSLTSITIPNSVTSIGSSAFYECTALTSITIPNSVTSIGDYAFQSCTSLTSITIPNSVTSIGHYAFSDCESLTSITIPNSVTSIGDGAFLLCYSLSSITIPNSVTSIGKGAFEGCVQLEKLTLGSAVKNIAANAFAGCNRLYHIYCYPTNPPVADQSSFSNYNVYLHVPCDYKEEYDLDIFWGNFKYIECIESEDVSTNGVVITPSTNDVTITWPAEAGADTYTIVIKKGNEVFCTLTFNADGQLLNIAFAPGRDGNHPAQYAEQAVNGYRFTVTGLEEATHYAYNIDVKNAANNTIKSHSGEFTTMGDTTTAVDNINAAAKNAEKLLRNGQLLILRDGQAYNVVGQIVE